MLHAIEHSLNTLSNAEQAAEDFVTGFAAGVKDMAQAAMLLARVLPGTPMWMASMAVDPGGTMKLQEQFAKGLAHMVEHPVDALETILDVKDLKSGDDAKWPGHLTPDVIVAVLTAGGGGAAAVAGEGWRRRPPRRPPSRWRGRLPRTPPRAPAGCAAEGAAKTAAEGAGEAGAEITAGKAAAESAGRAADDATAQAGKAGG
jgi:hypothetical protein